jgi:hypothetical protein
MITVPAAILSVMAGGFSMSQQLHLSDSANAQAHLVSCRSHFFALANGYTNYRHISNNCTDILNATLVNRSPCFVCLLSSLFLCGIIGVYGNINTSIGLPNMAFIFAIHDYIAILATKVLLKVLTGPSIMVVY